jgi:hypothetical protein
MLPKLWSTGRSPILRLRSGQAPAATPEPCCRYLQVTIPDSIDCIIAQGPALVRAEALGTIQPSGPFERALARLLLWPPTSVACGPSWRLPLPG